VRHRPEVWVDVVVVRNVVAVIAAWRGIERQQPERGNAQILQVIELFRQADEIADAVAIAVGKCLNMKLIDDRILEPKLVAFELRRNLMSAATSKARPFHAKRGRVLRDILRKITDVSIWDLTVPKAYGAL
jgi:hypothetical protein